MRFSIFLAKKHEVAGSIHYFMLSSFSKIVKRNRTTNEDLAKSIKKVLKTIDDARAVSLLNDIELDNFLPKQRTKLNSVIPYQLHQVELDKIIENQAKY